MYFYLVVIMYCVFSGLFNTQKIIISTPKEGKMFYKDQVKTALVLVDTQNLVIIIGLVKMVLIHP